MVEQYSQLDLSDMYQAYLDCRKNKKNKHGSMKFEQNALYNVQQITEDINKRKYTLSRSKCFIIPFPVKREVFCAGFRDRVVQHFIYNELMPVIDKLFIFDTASCRVGKGTDFAIDRLKRFVRSATDNYTKDAYYLKMDISGFFMRIDRSLLLNKVIDVIRNHYDGHYKEILEYLVSIVILTDVTKNTIRISPKEEWDTLPARKTLFNNPNGLPIGNICSQVFANYYLNDIDHFIKSRHRYYVRYVDDMVVVDKDFDKLKETMNIVSEMLRTLNMELSTKKTRILPLKYGIPFLGVKVYPHYTVIGRSRINRLYGINFSRKNNREVFASVASRRGMFIRYKGRNLCNRWYMSFPERVRNNIKLQSNLKFVYLEDKANSDSNNDGLDFCYSLFD